MLISIIVPTYNRAHMIRDSITSLLNQSHQNIEIIVVDDGSTDDTEEVVRGMAGPIRYFKKQNGGCSSARNMGIGLAKGDAVAFLDSDDQFEPRALETMVAALEKSGADFVYSPSIEVSADGKEVFSVPAAAGDPENFAREHFFTLGARANCVLYRRYIFDRFRFNETARYNEDSDLLQRVALNFKAAYSPIPTGKVFQHGGNKSSNKLEIGRALIRSYESILSDHPDFARSLGPLAQRRVDDLKTDLIEALVRKGELEGVKALVDSMGRSNLAVVLGLRFASGIPFVCRRYLRLGLYLAGRVPAVAARELGRLTASPAKEKNHA